MFFKDVKKFVSKICIFFPIFFGIAFFIVFCFLCGWLGTPKNLEQGINLLNIIIPVFYAFLIEFLTKDITPFRTCRNQNTKNAVSDISNSSIDDEDKRKFISKCFLLSVFCQICLLVAMYIFYADSDELCLALLLSAFFAIAFTFYCSISEYRKNDSKKK